jgi:ApaG protein
VHRNGPFYYRQTLGIRVTVRPAYLREQSRPAAGQWVFAYHVRIENVGTQAAQLLARRWVITDSAGEQHEVEGEGVVGEQPTLYPGRVHEYRSFCVLKSPRGAMEGEYRFVRPDGSRFEAAIPRFALEAHDAPGPFEA